LIRKKLQIYYTHPNISLIKRAILIRTLPESQSIPRIHQYTSTGYERVNQSFPAREKILEIISYFYSSLFPQDTKSSKIQPQYSKYRRGAGRERSIGIKKAL
jgi:hypothetical protein